ncbi:phospholipase D-like domain-containing protein [Alkalilimnicola ehrlichii]|uniref:phospholipase D-like domain-containing protein n=1 Tax=Alkalilimnicola ehrlichii TaxID=351052 RepID=UPI0021611C20|nr:phospholipase D-like domain-containing protein [Alkalilimnicola ehrlichii]
MPDRHLISALNLASMRGVQVDIVLPAHSNLPFVHWAMMAQLWQVLEFDCRVWLTPPPFDHSKLMVVDGTWSLIGSANWDPRSLRLNFEFNVECYNGHLAQALEKEVDDRIAHARQITLQDVDSRSLPVRLRDGVFRLFTPYL